MGTWYADEALADMHEQLQAIAISMSGDKSAQVQPYPRRSQLMEHIMRRQELAEAAEAAKEAGELDDEAAAFEAEMAARERDAVG